MFVYVSQYVDLWIQVQVFGGRKRVLFPEAEVTAGGEPMRWVQGTSVQSQSAVHSWCVSPLSTSSLSKQYNA